MTTIRATIDKEKREVQGGTIEVPPWIGLPSCVAKAGEEDRMESHLRQNQVHEGWGTRRVR
jgi:hypothetical protein